MAVDLAGALQIFFTGLHTTYQEAYQTPPTFWQDIAMHTTSTTELETYAWMDRIPRMRQWLGPRVINNVPTRSRSIVNVDFELTQAIPRNKFRDDKMSIYQPLAQLMAFEAKKLPDQQLAALMISNPVGFDGLSFFNTAHLSNIDDAGSATFNNALTLSLTPSNFGAARAAMRAWVGADGNPYGANPSMLVVPPQLEDVARRILFTDYSGRGQITPAAGVPPTESATAHASEQNIYKGAAGLVVIPELASQPSTWYLLDASTPIKPFIVQERQAPQFVYKGADSDDNVFWNKEYIWGVDARYGFDVTLPFLALRSVG